MPPDLNRVQEAFLAVRNLTPNERAAHLSSHYPDEPELHAEVESLLNAAVTDDQFLSAPARVVGEVPASDGALVGRTVGPYKLTRFIAAGGMGVVYEGWQPSLQRRVAIKLLRSPFETEILKRRFDFEARVLAKLQHANIAAIHDVGVFEGDTTGLGLPYFAMEFVEDAKTLDRYVREAVLAREDRLRLFATICDAVHYGHSRGVIHRDLKPGNILVGSDGSPKLIDFGLARSLEADDTDRSLLTQSGHVMGTLRYMSPEQVGGRIDEIDTRTDVYALGVILYELICDEHPYLGNEASFSEAARAICEQSPTRPTRLDRDVHRDLESVVLQALAKERDQRYASVAALADDVRRHLERRPVTARPPSVIDQLLLFTRRHRALSAAIGVAVVSLIAATVLSTVFAVKAERARQEEARQARVAKRARLAEEKAKDAERARADEAERLLVEAQNFSGWVIHKLQHRMLGVPNASDLRRDLNRRIVQHLERLLEIGVDRASIRRVLAMAFVETAQIQGSPRVSNLGDMDGALKNLQTAKGLLESHLAEVPNDQTSRQRLAVVHAMIADIAVSKGDTSAAETYRESLRILEAMLADRPGDLELHQHLGWVRGGLANLAALAQNLPAEVEHRDRALAHWDAILAKEPDDHTASSGLVATSTGLADSLMAAGRLDRVAALLDRAAKIAGTLRNREETGGDFDVASVSMLQARLAFAEDRRADGRALALATIERLRPLVKRDPKNAVYLSHLAKALRLGTVLASDAEREAFLEEAVDLHRSLRALAPERFQSLRSLGFCLFLLGRHFLRVGKIDDALDPLEEASKASGELVAIVPHPTDHQTLVDSSLLFGRHALREARRASAEERANLIERTGVVLERAKRSIEHLDAREQPSRKRDLAKLERALRAMKRS